MESSPGEFDVNEVGAGRSEHRLHPMRSARLKELQREYEDLVVRKIPSNIREIGAARKKGDPAQSPEYKLAKEKQAVLQRRKAELERELTNSIPVE